MTEEAVCGVCGKPIAVGEWPCISRIVEHAPSVQTSAFAAYFDHGLGIEVTGLGDRKKAMRENHLDYRDKMSAGDQSARLDRVHEERRRRG